MTGMLLDTVQRARGLARDLVGDEGFVSQVTSGSLGGNPINIHYYGRRRFSDDCQILLDARSQHAPSETPTVVFGPLQFFLERHHVHDRQVDADVQLLDTFLSHGDLDNAPLFAPHVDATLMVEATLDAQLGRLRSNRTRRKMKQLLGQGFSWRMSNRMEDFQHFYDNMYLPTVATRFGPSGFVESREEMEHTFNRRGTLLFTGGDAGLPESAAILCTFPHRPGLLHYWKTGVAHCESLSPTKLTEQYARVEAAVLQHAVHERFAEIHFGLTRALLNDGVFIHKTRLGCNFQHNPTYLDAEIRVNPSVRAHLLSLRPMVLWRGSTLVCWIGHEGELTPDATEELKARLRACRFPLVRSVSLFTRGVVDTRDILRKVVDQFQSDYTWPVDVTMDD